MCRMGKRQNRKRDTSERPNFIYAWRRYRGLTQEALSELTGIAPSTISFIERGAKGTTLATLDLIAIALCVKTGWLLSRDPYKPGDAWEIAEELESQPDADRERAADVLRALLRSKG
jgi:transcriptional regulator with XRE-family HTH domain